MYEPTREQEAKIAAMALEHGSVAVEVVSGTVVKATVGGVSWLVYQDGDAAKAPPEYATVNIPTEFLKALLGAEYLDIEIAQIQDDDAFPEHTLGRAVRENLVAQLRSVAIG